MLQEAIASTDLLKRRDLTPPAASCSIQILEAANTPVSGRKIFNRAMNKMDRVGSLLKED